MCCQILFRMSCHRTEGWKVQDDKARITALRLTYPFSSESEAGVESVEVTNITAEFDLPSSNDLPVKVNAGIKSEGRSVLVVREGRRQDAEILLRVAAGPWRTVATVKPELGTVEATGGDVVFLKEKDFTRKVVVPVDHPVPADQMHYRTMRNSSLSVIDGEGNVQRRVVVVDRQGREIPALEVDKTVIGSRVRSTVMLVTEMQPKDSLLEDVREVRLQTRPFRWVRFENIALDPKGGIPPQPPPAPAPSIRAVNYLCVTLTPKDPDMVNELASDCMFGDRDSAVFRTMLAENPTAYLAALRSAFPKYRFTPIVSGTVYPDSGGRAEFHYSLPRRQAGYGIASASQVDIVLNVNQNQGVNGSVILDSKIDSMAEDDATAGRRRRTVVLGWEINRMWADRINSTRSETKVAHVLLDKANVLGSWGNPIDTGSPGDVIIACPVP